ncbi:TraR/DksA family transcriptional regulator [Yunchengibacter salinarum]|uniref:TraR/DksA family transcriptional regulator n=1 Tax=Yunchengibacter salinarum TaxID=3133399 RepID=UPI0035B69370
MNETLPDYDDVVAWKARLEDQRRELLALDQTSAEGRAAVDLDQQKVGRLSRMDALQGQAMNNAISARRQNALSRIDAALKRLESGEFGACLKCGDDIPLKRLALDPSATVCADCAG